MKISAELTLTPLQNNFEEPIIRFIKKLRASQFVVLENPLSTQIFGEYDLLMPYLIEEIKASFEDQENVVMNLKIVKSDRSDYEPHF
ncbi:MAG: Uncharacterised protein [Flavobacterium sp. SCGC AAA160-P02]|nr:MAG: Uncharacterised protein [Flavobacterium sp. SCGC AAA160-P02]|tara:strand:+ start:3555 stop:3815 length:261 start_codon:yes stop_codon:yes gene_type:complete